MHLFSGDSKNLTNKELAPWKSDWVWLDICALFCHALLISIFWDIYLLLVIFVIDYFKYPLIHLNSFYRRTYHRNQPVRISIIKLASNWVRAIFPEFLTKLSTTSQSVINGNNFNPASNYCQLIFLTITNYFYNSRIEAKSCMA